jgi:hypothetical protein
MALCSSPTRTVVLKNEPSAMLPLCGVLAGGASYTTAVEQARALHPSATRAILQFGHHQ